MNTGTNIERESVSPESSIDGRLSRIETEVREVRAATNRTNTAYGLFAGLAVLLAGASLVAVAAKMHGPMTTRVVTVSTPAPASTQAPAPAAPLTHASAVTLREFAIAPAPAQAAQGKTTFSVHNAGQLKHEFVVVRTDKPAGSLLKGAEADETGNVGEIPDLPPGSTKSLTLNLKAGHYALICNLPGHYKAGQHADFTVR